MSHPDSSSLESVFLFLGPRCGGIEDGCCTAGNPCKEGDGDCDNDTECMGDLVCGVDNCKWGHGDCCITIGKL